ncbi:hypothetical protein QFZ34_000375 [Phyllobacterium ifriqiyense]|uniref:Uncharacterized protein n=1 Tax=Phyllobacterium ifriqiyense TaxID=314238 RepID=A0ABU0S6A9_9HYPH|nr:hypothetical protein [Phyllobacterium ifriqiyense]
MRIKGVTRKATLTLVAIAIVGLLVAAAAALICEITFYDSRQTNRKSESYLFGAAWISTPNSTRLKGIFSTPASVRTPG